MKGIYDDFFILKNDWLQYKVDYGGFKEHLLIITYIKNGSLVSSRLKPP